MSITRADIWALGTIHHELLSGEPPFDGPTASALHAAIAMDPPPPLRTKRPDAPAALEAIVLHCLEKNPAQRFQSVGELADALRPYATQIGQIAASRVVRVVPSQQPVIVSIQPPATTSYGNASTMGAWNQRTATSAQLEKKSSLGLVLGLVFAALLLLLVAGIAAFAIFFRGTSSQTVVVNNATTSSAVPTVTTTSIVPDVVPVASTPSAKSPATPRPAQAGVKDAGAPAPSSDDRRAVLARSLKLPCDADSRNMSTGDDATRKNTASRSSCGTAAGPTPFSASAAIVRRRARS